MDHKCTLRLPQVVRGVTRLRLHVLVVIGLMLLVHAVCYLMLIILINKQKAFITEISAAGEGAAWMYQKTSRFFYF